MIKSIAIPIILLFGAIPSAISSTSHSQIANNGATVTKANSHEIAFFNDLFGESALKWDCLRHWGMVSQESPISHPSLYEKKCKKAKLEIEFAFREYPGLLDLAKFLKYERVANSDPIATFNSIQKLKRKCSDKTAIRAARTARYWGTTEVGGLSEVKNTVIGGFSEINAGQYRIILEACEKDSWLDKKIVLLQDGLNNKLNNLASSSAKISPLCDLIEANKLKSSIGNQYVNNIQKKSSEYQDALEELERLEQTFDSMIMTANDIPESSQFRFEKIAKAREQLKKRLKACNNALIVSRKHSSDNQKAKQAKERLRRQYAAEEQRKRNYQNAVDSVDLD